MAQRIRFTTAAQVFEAFPRAAFDIGSRPVDEGPIEFVRTLIARAHRYDAVTYAAYLLPKREAVWWGCQCLRAFSPAYADEALMAAEAWVRTPDETTRRAFTGAIAKLEHNIGLLRLNLNSAAALEDFLLASLRLWTKR